MDEVREATKAERQRQRQSELEAQADAERAEHHRQHMTEKAAHSCEAPGCGAPSVVRHSEEIDGKVQPAKFYCAEHRPVKG